MEIIRGGNHRVMAVVCKALAGGTLVVVFALIATTLRPLRFAGLFSAAPSVALASLGVTLATKGSHDARLTASGMVAGALAFIAYGALTARAMRRWGVRWGTVAPLAAWLAVSAALLPMTALGPVGTTAASFAGISTPSRGHRTDRPRLDVSFGRLRDATLSGLALRFAFGAGVSAAAGVIGKVWGPVVSGPFLAFPAILIASLTLIAREHGEAAARDDARGSALGAVGLVAFAAVGAALFTRWPAAAVLAVATGTWAVVAGGAYAVAWVLGAGADEPSGGTRP